MMPLVCGIEDVWLDIACFRLEQRPVRPEFQPQFPAERVRHETARDLPSSRALPIQS